MVTLTCHTSNNTFNESTLNELIYKICEHLSGEPAFRSNDIFVSNADENGEFYICLGGTYNKENLNLNVTFE